MLTLPAELIEELESEASFTCLFAQILHTTPVYYNNSDVDIYWEGIRHRSYPFQIRTASISLGEVVTSLDVDFDNISTELASLALNNELRGTEFKLYFASIDENLNVIGTIPLFIGDIIQIEFTDEIITFTVMDEMYRWRDKQLNNHSPLCPWRFKDPNTCKYAGTETWCDKTYDRCAELGNTAHFGGFRHLPSIQEKEIWWGRRPK